MFLKSQKAFLLALNPLRKISADLNNLSEGCPCSYSGDCFSTIFPFLHGDQLRKSAMVYCKHSFPIPPVDVKIRGVKVPCSMSKTLLEYRHFSFL